MTAAGHLAFRRLLAQTRPYGGASRCPAQLNRMGSPPERATHHAVSGMPPPAHLHDLGGITAGPGSGVYPSLRWELCGVRLGRHQAQAKWRHNSVGDQGALCTRLGKLAWAQAVAPGVTDAATQPARARPRPMKARACCDLICACCCNDCYLQVKGRLRGFATGGGGSLWGAPPLALALALVMQHGSLHFRIPQHVPAASHRQLTL